MGRMGRGSTSPASLLIFSQRFMEGDAEDLGDLPAIHAVVEGVQHLEPEILRVRFRAEKYLCGSTYKQPAVSTGIVALLGISHAGYLTTKSVPSNPAHYERA